MEVIQGTFNDVGWVRINPEQIKRLLTVFDTDTSVQTAYHVRMNSVLSGGIKFKRRFHSMNEWNNRLFSGIITKMTRKIWRLKWSIGIVPITFREHPVFGWVPKVLDVDPARYECMMKPGSGGADNVYRWYELGTPSSSSFVSTPSTGNISRTLLKNVITLVENDPYLNGDVRSLVKNLDRGAHLEEVMYQCTEDALPRMAIPGIVSERPEEKLDPDNLRNPLDPIFSVGLKKTLTQLNESSRYSSVEPAGDRPAKGVSDTAIMINNLLNSKMMASANGEWGGSEAHQSRAIQARCERMARTRQDLGPQLYLPDGRKLSKQLESKAPEDMLEYMTLRKATICEVFSVPYHMLSAHGAKSGAGPAATKIFNDAQKALHEQILEDLHLVYTWIYSKGDLAAFFAHKAEQLKGAKHRNEQRKAKRNKRQDKESEEGREESEEPNAKKMKLTTEQEEINDDDNDPLEPEEWILDENEMRAYTEISIQVLGLPDFDVVRELRLDGFYKYDAFVSYCCTLFSLDKSDFNPAPELTLKDLRGVKDVEPVANS